MSEPTELTDDELDRLQALCDVATEGPWEFARETDMSVSRPQDPSGCATVVVWGRNWDAESYDPGSVSGIAASADGDFIAASRTALPLLIAEVRRLRGAHNDVSERYETLLNQLGATDT